MGFEKIIKKSKAFLKSKEGKSLLLFIPVILLFGAFFEIYNHIDRKDNSTKEQIILERLDFNFIGIVSKIDVIDHGDGRLLLKNFQCVREYMGKSFGKPYYLNRYENSAEIVDYVLPYQIGDSVVFHSERKELFVFRANDLVFRRRIKIVSDHFSFYDDLEKLPYYEE